MLIQKVHSGIHSTVIELTPELAQHILEMNTGNRPIRMARVERMAQAMSQGRWKCNGEPIIVSKTNRVLSGQHRLHAVLQSGVSISTLYVEGVDDDCSPTIDQQAKRTPGDALSIAGVANYNTVASLSRWVMANNRRQIVIYGKFPFYSNEEVVEFVEDHPDIVEIASEAKSMTKNKSGTICGSAVALGFVMYHLHRRPNDHGSRFLKQLTTEIGWAEDSPSYVLAKTFRKAKNQQGSRGIDLSYVLTITVKAYLASLRGQSVKMIRVAEDETFPYLDF